MDTRAKFFGFVMVGAISLAGCGDEEPKPPGTGGDGSAAGAPAGCDVDFGDLAAAPAVSFRNDVMHVFGLSCTLGTACHGTASTPPKADLLLGPPCGTYDTATGKCPFSTTPLTEDIITQVHTNLVSVLAVTVTSPMVMRVAPGDPANSFLIQKTADIHENQGYICTPQDSTAMTPCGDEMPRGQALCLQNNGQTRFDKIAKWILDGAQNN